MRELKIRLIKLTEQDIGNSHVYFTTGNPNSVGWGVFSFETMEIAKRDLIWKIRQNNYSLFDIKVNTIIKILFISSATYWSLRWHPITYDIGRHVEGFLRAKSALRIPIMPGIIPVKLLNYGLLSFFPADPAIIVWGLFTVGWFAFTALSAASSIWSQRFFKLPWIGFLLILILGNFPPRNFLLFASHPYEIGMNFILVSLFLNFSNFPKTSILFSSLGFLVHPNLVLMTLFSGGVTIYRFPTLFLYFGILFFFSLIFYFGTSQW